MFAKGPMPGATPKADALEIHPKAYCERVVGLDFGTNRAVRGYAVKLPGAITLATAGNAQEAWRKAASVKPPKLRRVDSSGAKP